jgi:hypothetical protein
VLQARPILTLVPIRPRSRCELHSLRTFSLAPVVPIRPRRRGARRSSRTDSPFLSSPVRRSFVARFAPRAPRFRSRRAHAPRRLATSTDAPSNAARLARATTRPSPERRCTS